MHRGRILPVVWLAFLSWPVATRSGEGEGPKAADIIADLSDHAKRRIAEFQKSLPAGYTVQPAVQRQWSDDERKILTHLVSMTPVAPDGKIDGEMQYIGRWWIARTVPYRKGVKHGDEKKYIYDGKARKRLVVAEIRWSNGKIDGVKRLYHQNGKLRLETPFQNGLRHGVSKEYDLVGRPGKITHYRQGKRHGEMIENWTLTGKPRRIVPYVNDVIEGLVREFYDSGLKKKEVAARNDLFHGIERQYDEEGDLIKTKYWIEDEEVMEPEFRQKFRP